MNELRKFLGSIFGFAALIFAWAGFNILRRAGRTHFESHLSLTQTAVWLLLTAFLGFSAWSILTNRGSARIFGLAASMLPLLGLVALMVIARVKNPAVRLHGMPWAFLGLAAAGGVAFFPRRSALEKAAKAPVSVTLPGDGTNAWIDKSIWIVGVVLFLYFNKQWFRWAESRHLRVRSEFPFLLQIVLAELAVVLFHELGHAITGLVLGMKLRAFIVGPFQWRIRDGKWQFKLNVSGFLSTGGATALVPTSSTEPRWRRAVMVAGGPFASYLAGVAALWLALNAANHPWEQAFPFLACIATLSLLAAVLNLVPFKTGETYSDGAHLYQLLANGIWADYHSAVSTVASSLVTPLRPRDYDISAIDRAVLAITEGPRAMLLHLHATSYHLDHGQISQAAHSFTQAEAVLHASVPELPTELHTAFIFRKALLHRDAAGTRQWWDRMEAKKPTRFNVDYWLAHAALHWIESRPAEARESCAKASSLAQQLPDAGAYAFDRDRCEMLRKAIDLST